jgi:exonuclease III
VDRKREFFSSLAAGLTALREQLDGRLVVLGDHNSVPRDHVPAHPGFTTWEYQWHDDLEKLGLRNVHALVGREQPYSWVGRTGNAYLYDYAHIGDALAEAVADFSYLTDPRSLKLSDHAAVTARLDSPTAARTIVS